MTATGRLEPSDASAEHHEDGQKREKTDDHSDAPRLARQPLSEAQDRGASDQAYQRSENVESKLTIVWEACDVLFVNPLYP